MKKIEAYSPVILKKQTVDLDARKQQALATRIRANNKKLQAIPKKYRAMAKQLDFSSWGIKSE